MSVIDTSTDLGARAAGRLAEEPVAWLVTVDPHGTPQPTPVWFVRTGDGLVVASQPATAKLRNVRANPRVALHLNSTRTGDDVIVLVGAAAIDDAGLTEAERDAYDAKYSEPMRGIGMTPAQFHEEYSVILRIAPEKLRGF
ncbi:TIGR03667 family PPOX class F420-dependent oxidoreductase [Oerskovia flava]|uniref:TIGR03667 family PPOX class F420-dependent oxidoreductase n=1 Tax=Oerskovia flava TaxID=2986422 RepID=UPI00223F9979|nr:TIGR03667 family PPOX class F420-dependent oxidoreductase [Oerskovia sp. JB1-3-2]